MYIIASTIDIAFILSCAVFSFIPFTNTSFFIGTCNPSLEYTDSLIYLKALITINNDDINGLYHYAIVCQEMAKKYQKDNDDQLDVALLLIFFQNIF